VITRVHSAVEQFINIKHCAALLYNEQLYSKLVTIFEMKADGSVISSDPPCKNGIARFTTVRSYQLYLIKNVKENVVLYRISSCQIQENMANGFQQLGTRLQTRYL